MKPAILVAVDIIEDQVVRLTRGELQEKTVYGDDPIEAAIDWESKGAEWLHVIDLEGATQGREHNSTSIEKILEAVKIPVEVGGGIRSLDAISRWLDKGAARVLIGTRTLDAEFLSEAIRKFGDKVLPAVDSRGGAVRISGWQQPGGASLIEAVSRVAESGASRLMFTDIDRDGALIGPNVDAIEEVLETIGIPLIASGGVTSEHDVRLLARLAPKGLEGIIIGKALYSGTLSLKDAQEAAEV